MSDYEHHLAIMNDLAEALKSAIAHSGAGAQRTRWEALQVELARDHAQLTKQLLRARDAQRAAAERDARRLADIGPLESDDEFIRKEMVKHGVAPEPIVETAPNTHPEDGGPQEIAFEKPAEG